MNLNFCWNKRNKLVFAAAAVYVAAVFLGAELLRRIPEDSLWVWAVTLLPLAGAFLLVWAAVRATLMGDEMEQRAAAIGAVATLVLLATTAIGWGILEAFAGMPPISALWWGVGAVGAWGLVSTLVWYRYQ